MYKIYHNNRCSKSRKTLEILKNKNVKFEVCDYLANPLSKDEIIFLLKLLRLQPMELVRKNEKIYKNNNLKECDSEQLIDAMVKYPILIERPIVVSAGKAVIGRPPENVLKII